MPEQARRAATLISSITLSPVYPAAASLLGSERGLSMRFPRFMKRRDDKTWEQASTSEQFADMYRRQIQEAPKRDKPVDSGDRRLVNGHGSGEGGGRTSSDELDADVEQEDGDGVASDEGDDERDAQEQ